VNQRKRRGWPFRISAVVLFWAASWGLAAALKAGPQPFVLACRIGAIASVYWFIADFADLWSNPRYELYPEWTNRDRERSDGRLRQLRQLCESAAEDERRRPGVEESRRRLQSTILRIVQHKLATSGIRFDPQTAPAQQLAPHLPEDLARYLLADPPARLSAQQVRILIDRIEAL
jgi:hypothetical protein